MTETVDTKVNTGSHETFLKRAGESKDEAILFLHGSGPAALTATDSKGRHSNGY